MTAGKDNSSESLTRQRTASVLCFYCCTIFIAETSTGKVTFVEAECLVLNSPSFNSSTETTVFRWRGRLCVAGCADPGCIWGVTPSPSRASPLRTGTPAELFPSPGPSWANSWRILFTQAFVTKQHQGLVSEAPEPQKRSSFFKKKQGIFLFIKLLFCQTRNWNTGLCGFGAWHVRSVRRETCPEQDTHEAVSASCRVLISGDTWERKDDAEGTKLV